MNIGIISHKKGFFKIFLKKQPNAFKKNNQTLFSQIQCF